MNKEDHDLVIKYGVKIDTLCRAVKTLSGKFDDYHTKIDNRCEQRHVDIYDRFELEQKKTMDKDTFKWLIGFLIIVIMALVSAVGYNQVNLRGHIASTAFIVHKIDENTKLIKFNTDQIKSNQVLMLRSFSGNPTKMNALNGAGDYAND